MFQIHQTEAFSGPSPAGCSRPSLPSRSAQQLMWIPSTARLRPLAPPLQALQHITTPTTPHRRCGPGMSMGYSTFSNSKSLMCMRPARPSAVASSSTSRAGGHVRVGVLEHNDDGGSSRSGGEVWGHSSHGAGKQWLRTPDDDKTRDSEEDHSANQITLFLSLSVTLITLPWLFHHPETLLVPLALLLMPMPGSALRPALLEGILMLASAARWMADSHSCPSSTHSTPGSPSHVSNQDRQQQQQQAGSWSSSSPAAQHQQPSTSSAYAAPYASYPRSTSFHSTHPHAGASPAHADAQAYSTHHHTPLRPDHPNSDHRPYTPVPEAYASYDEYPASHPSAQAWGFHASMDRSHGQQQEAVMDSDWPAGSGEGGGSGSGSAGGSSSESWQRHVLQNLSDIADPAFSYPYAAACHESSPPALGPYSVWPQSSMHPHSYPQPQQPVMHPQPHADPLLASSVHQPQLPPQHPPQHQHQHQPPQQHQHQRLHPKDAPPSPLASAERYHDMHPPQQQQQTRSSSACAQLGAGQQSGAAWHSMLFSVAPWMKSWGGFL